ncbi:hypothetical protein ACFWE3_18305 [Mycobacteriaceae bacterium NPDC060252]
MSDPSTSVEARHRQQPSGTLQRLKSSRLAMGALASVVVVGALVADIRLTSSDQWDNYFGWRTPQHVIAVDQAQVIEGQTWKLGKVRTLGKSPSAYARPLPRGSQLVVVDIVREGTPRALYCNAVLTDGTRRWKADNFQSVRIPDGYSTFCNKPGSLEFVFLVPADAQPTAIDIVDSLTQAKVIRLEI